MNSVEQFVKKSALHPELELDLQNVLTIMHKRLADSTVEQMALCPIDDKHLFIILCGTPEQLSNIIAQVRASQSAHEISKRV